GLGATIPCLTQTGPVPDGGNQSFEVATIKPAAEGNVFLGIKSPGLFGTDNNTMTGLLMEAYGVRGFQIQGGPNWIRTDRFEIRAKYDPRMGAESPEHLWQRIDAMLKHLLEDRFALRAHAEVRQLPTYSLVVSRKGVNMKPSQCTPRDAGP